MCYPLWRIPAPDDAALHGALLRSEKTASDYTLSVLKRCQSRGILLAATPAPSAQRRAAFPAFAGTVLPAHNGAVVRLPGGETERQGIPAAARVLLAALVRELPRAPFRWRWGSGTTPLRRP